MGKSRQNRYLRDVPQTNDGVTHLASRTAPSAIPRGLFSRPCRARSPGKIASPDSSESAAMLPLAVKFFASPNHNKVPL